MSALEGYRPDGVLRISAGATTIDAINRHDPEGILGPYMETMLPADHAIFVAMMRGQTLTMNGIAYPVRTLSEQRQAASFSEACDANDG